jgi:hypothetical protein
MHDALAKFTTVFSLSEENKAWIVLLKVSCLEENEMAVHPKHWHEGDQCKKMK